MAAAESPNLAEYKAGRMILLGKMVEPDDRKGLLYVRRSPDNQMHIHWMDRRSRAVELDIVATPGSLEFRRIDGCTTGRVYVLKSTRSTQRYFFWMQEPQVERDADFCRRVNELIAAGERKWDESAAVDGDVDTDVESRRGGGGATGGDLRVLEEMRRILETTLAAPPESWVQVGQSMLAENRNRRPEEAATPWKPDKVLDLAAALRYHGEEAVVKLLDSPVRRQKLLDQLPNDPEEEEEGTPASQIILEHLQSPQFNESLSDFSVGLHHGALRSILEPLLNDKEALDAAKAGDIERFLRVLHRKEKGEEFTGPAD
ncbi:proteasomal ubiquitin receptor ADRM1 homolog [Drosophila ficusphila]|uniref:proteasomal ubiquitin receptor ADRM1 homolog n=1 Tax=Drosophila ficusphila TaxID=30025 RepID=UPI0007E72F42|nr:proteasomal ubiquitin receptor ADRM1 homolog [Drosophila ficusphila]